MKDSSGGKAYPKRIIALLFGTLIALGVLAVPLYVIWDVGHHGPQVTRFNHRCENIVREQHLIGKGPEALVNALGNPTSVDHSWKDGWVTYNYAPHPWFPYAKFQAHFKGGKLDHTELFDD